MTVHLESRETGMCVELPVDAWASPATPEELAVLATVRPAVLDVGCGPGRISHALGARGVPALGIDVAPAALKSATATGATVLERSVFDELPGEGRWGTVLLFDGNIGIGGDPVALLARIADLLSEGGELLVELGPPGTPTLTEDVRIRTSGNPPGPWFGWATVSVDDIEEVASRSGLCVSRVQAVGCRHFSWLGARARVGALERLGALATPAAQPAVQAARVGVRAAR